MHAVCARVVSIHAPRCRGTKWSMSYTNSVQHGFNPRPPLPGDESDAITWAAIRESVSIHAPVAGGRKLNNLAAAVLSAVSIHAPVAGGRNVPRRSSWWYLPSFSPRPRCRGTKASSETRYYNWEISPHCANLQMTTGKNHTVPSAQKRKHRKLKTFHAPRTSRVIRQHSGFAENAHSTSGSSKLVALNMPCSLTSQPRPSANR